jgi:hypothetical protein
MDAALWSNVVAVAGTLAGGLVASVAQARAARVERRETRREDRRGEVVAAVTRLVSALADHRRAMWLLQDRRLSGADAHVVDEAQAASHETRSAVTAPLATVRLLAPALADTAQQAAQASYAMRNAPDADTLEALRAAALAASDRLVDEAAGVFAGMAVAS